MGKIELRKNLDDRKAIDNILNKWNTLTVKMPFIEEYEMNNKYY